MKKPTISTIILIIALLILGLYAAGEVNYFSTKLVEEKHIDSPTIIIPKIGVQEKINNISINQGVFHEPKSYTPTNGEVIIFGHRTLQGSPFLRLNELEAGDTVILDWPGIGEANYTIKNSTIVPGTYKMSADPNENNIYLITCDPIGSSANRLIYEGQLSSTGDINNTIIHDNPQQYYGLLILIGFFIIGMIISYITPKDNRIYILFTALAITAILIYFYFFPIPSEIIYAKIGWLNGGFINSL